MPSITLTDVARLRVQTISFFLVGFLLSAGLIQLLWNYLRRDFTFLPRLSYGKAVGVVALWGLLFVLVLTMISGARELMTPGAWEKQGATYRLAQPPAPAPSDEQKEEARRQKLERLRMALWNYAVTHDGRLPPDRTVTDIPRDAWQLPDPSGVRYVYVGGQTAGRGASPVAYEPDLYGPQRLVLLTNGDIRRMELAEIVQAQSREKR
jgi:hypothetical protein